jgi:hypothetical protein
MNGTSMQQQSYTPSRYDKTCRHKQPYPTRRQARLAAQSHTRSHGGSLQSYRCMYCANWHIGHNQPPKLRRAKRNYYARLYDED